MKKQNLQINTKTIEERFIVLRGQEVLIDRDVAELYGVETKRVNEAVKNNPKNSLKDIILRCNRLKNSMWSKISTG